MILGRTRIKQEMNQGNIVIEPFDERQLGPNSYDLRLADKLLVYTDRRLDAYVENPTMQIQIPKEGFELQPGVGYLGSTVEYTETRGCVPIMEGRSSIGRLFLSVHCTAGFGDNGFTGHWTLEMSVTQPLRIYAGMRVCQIGYILLAGGSADEVYRGKYAKQGPLPVASQLWKDFDACTTQETPTS